jgi:heparin/heparan-sulfate lyase
VIYHRGYLALDSGTRYKEFDNGEHLANYFAQTVAHNCVVIQQPGEPPARYWGGTVTGNHGGQHKQLGSVVKAFETRDEYVYVAGDATACYRHGSEKVPEKCGLVTRQLVFLLPDHFVVFDRVEATNAAYGKQWLIHTAHKPAIAGRTVRADHGEGRMYCQTLLPEDAVLTAVGGEGKAYWAAGKNWEIVSDGLSEENLAMMGQWRVEVAPGAARKVDVFLHVIQVGDRGLARMAETELLREEGVCGVRLETGGRRWEVTFSVDGALGGHIRGMGARAVDRALATTVQAQSGI